MATSKKKSKKRQKETKTAAMIKRQILDMKIVGLVVAQPGLSASDIALQCGIHRGTVEKRLNSPEIQDLIEKLAHEAVDILTDAQKEAATRLITLMRSGNAEVSLKACKEILKNVLPEKHEHTVITVGAPDKPDDAEDE